MSQLLLHHVSIVTTDLDRSVAFYQDLFGFARLHRPTLKVPGAWLACGPLQLHIILNPAGTFRAKPEIDIGDAHFAFRTDDFEGMLDRLGGKGFSDSATAEATKQLVVIRNSPAGFPQLYLLDPDLNIVEVNGAP